MKVKSPIFQKIMQQTATEGSSLASTQSLRNMAPQSLAESAPTGDLGSPPKGVDFTPTDPNPMAFPRYQGGTSEHGKFMDKLFDVETKGGRLKDRPGSQYKGIAQIGDDIRKPLLKQMGYTEAQYNASKDIQVEVADKHINNLRSRLKKNGFEVSDKNLWIAHNLGVGGLNQILHNKVSSKTLKNIRNQAGMTKSSSPADYMAYYGDIFK